MFKSTYKTKIRLFFLLFFIFFFLFLFFSFFFSFSFFFFFYRNKIHNLKVVCWFLQTIRQNTLLGRSAPLKAVSKTLDNSQLYQFTISFSPFSCGRKTIFNRGLFFAKTVRFSTGLYEWFFASKNLIPTDFGYQ